MPKKNHYNHQPEIAVFDLLQLVSNESSECANSILYTSRPARRKRSARPALSNKTLSSSYVTTDTLVSARIAVLVASLSDHYTNSIIAGIEVAGAKTGYQIAILNILSKQPLQTGLDLFDGFIACCSDEEITDTDFFDNLGKPVIVVGNSKNAGGYHCVKTDYYKGAQLAVSHLIDQGCRQILMIAPALEDTTVGLDPYLGYRDTLKKAGMEWQEPHTFSEASIEAGMELAAKMIGSGTLPDGIFISNDRVAAGFAKYLEKSERGGVRKIAVVGFGNEPLCEMIAPSLCSIDFRMDLAGIIAFDVLFRQISCQQIRQADPFTVIEPALVSRVSENR